MQILIAEDDDISRLILQAMLCKRGYEVKVAEDGKKAWEVLRTENSPPLAILDWEMPGIDGLELCRMIRSESDLRHLYIILLTGRGKKEHIVEGLRAGANDYVVKPFDNEELEARVKISAQVVGLQNELKKRVNELEDTLSRVKQLQGLLPICAWCKRVRDDRDYWHQVETYVSEHSEARFTHGICPPCFEKQMNKL